MATIRKIRNKWQVLIRKYNLNLPLKKIALNNQSIDNLYITLKKNKLAETDLLFIYKK